nr:probable phosphorylase b kinase regulatory subunit alpha [Leptinotarsa decemlineata]
MRNRSNSGVRLDYYQRQVHKIIMEHQNQITGLFPLSTDNNHAWIRDNVYCILSVWGLSMAYKKMADQDEDRAKTYELEQTCIKLMRGLLMSMMQQKDKVEKFKQTQNPLDSLHAKYSSVSGQIVVGDNEWGHLQIDAISLYLLVLAQMTASGLQIIFTLDEVAFIQNLVFYIECAYCTPDYGIWERGDKTNHGLPELNASSIGMAKAALEAMNELDLFGARGGPYSIIHVLADEAQKCQAVLQSMLPRESSSKEIDSGLLSVIGFPAFAVDDPSLIEYTRDCIIEKLQGQYGCKRFLRDGYKTPKEDPRRLYYEPWELRMFENIECEWPLFFCYLILDNCFRGNKEIAAKYTKQMEEIMIRTEEGMRLVPELYSVPAEFAAAEYKEPGSQQRIPLGQCPFLWAQSLFIVGKLLQEGFLAPGELDPLNRRLCSEKKPDVVVQVVILAEDNEVKDKLAEHDIHVQTIADVAPIEVQPARVLSHLYTYLGRNKKLGLSGRKSRDVGILSTSKLYSLGDKIFAFTPQFTDMSQNYTATDYELMIDICKGELNFLKSSWQNMLGRPLVTNLDLEEYYTSYDIALLADKVVAHLSFLTMNWRNMLGRPTITVVATKNHLEDGKLPLAMITTMKKLNSGYINGTRVTLGNLNDFLSTSCITNLNFLGCHEDGLPDKLNPQVQQYLEEHSVKSLSYKSSSLIVSRTGTRNRQLKRKMSVRGAVKKTRSINVDSDTLGMESNESLERRGSMFFSASSIDKVDNPFIHRDKLRTPSPERKKSSVESPRESRKELPNISITRHRNISETQYAETEVEELFAMLRESDSLDEQGDILQYLVDSQGLNFNTGMLENGKIVTVKDLLKGLYAKACLQKMWGLVRHSAGMLGKRVEDLAKSVTDLLVRQKQITVGMPPNNEHTITAPLPESDLRLLIHEAYGEDDSTAMLTQELLSYLAMFIRTEPQLFMEMLRLRVGLIIQVMATELSRTLICDGDEASEHLLNLSPFEMKNLLHHIISGKEFAISSAKLTSSGDEVNCCSSGVHIYIHPEIILIAEDDFEYSGTITRCSPSYNTIGNVTMKCQGLDIAGKVLPQTLTQEMTSGELKFALAVETVLNTIPQPEYRQLIVEALMVLTLVSEHNIAPNLGGIIQVEFLVHKANELFLDDQMKCEGDATLCCAKPKDFRETSRTGGLLCGGAAYICQHFYDSAPSGCYGTMTYMTRAVAVTLECLPKHGELDCTIS